MIEKEIKLLINYCISFGISALLMRLYLYTPIYNYIRTNIVKSNLLPYVVMMGVFIAMTLFNCYVQTRDSLICLKYKFDDRIAKIVACLIVVMTTFAFWRCLVNEKKLFAVYPPEILTYHLNENITGVVLLALFVLIGILLYNRINYISENLYNGTLMLKISIIIFVFILGGLYAYSIFTPNGATTHYNSFHSGAYLNSIYNTMLGTPRSALNSSAYGYYAFFIAPIANMFGGGLYSIYWVLAIFSLFAYLALVVTLFKIVGVNSISLVGCIALITQVTSINFQIYKQGIPHRILFACILSAYLAAMSISSKNEETWNEKKHFLKKIIGLAIITAAVIWNAETGIICAIVYVVYNATETLQKHRIKEPQCLKRIVYIIAEGFTAVVLAWMVANAINVLCYRGNLLDLKTFLFPLTASMSKYTMTEYDKPLSAWWLIVAMASYTLLIGVSSIKEFKNKTDVQNNSFAAFYVALAVLVLGQLTYYINRQAWENLCITYPFVIINLCILIKKFSGKAVALKESCFFRILNKGMAQIGCTVLLSFCLLLVALYPNCEKYRTQHLYRNMIEIRKIEKNIALFCPKNTRALGYPLLNLYIDMKWDPYYHIIDSPDWFSYEGVNEYLINELNNNNLDKGILVDQATKNYLDCSMKFIPFYDKFILQNEFQIFENKVYYFVPKGNI